MVLKTKSGNDIMKVNDGVVVVNNNSCGKLFPLNIFKLILKVVPVLFLTAVFSFFSRVSDNLTFTLLY